MTPAIRASLWLLCIAAPVAGAAEPAAKDPSRAAAVEEAQPAVRDPVVAKATRPAKPRASGATADAAAKAPKAQDSLELDASKITGTRELPKVMAVVPWKRSDIGDLAGRPVNSLVDEALQPVDREVFRREISYYGALDPDRPKAETRVTGAAAGAGPEK
jgi:hypothetical protein